MNKWNKFLTEGELKTVGIVACLNDKQQFLVIRRSDIDDRVGQWTMPGGHIDDKDSSIEAGAIRELKEEAGLNCKISDLVYLGMPKSDKYMFLTQKWNGQVDVSRPNPETGEIEHDAYKWLTIDEVKELADNKIPIYLLQKALEITKNETNS
jgi:8-oxo-dGTP pyrophosphatase MutT (NUDIX family)